MNMTTSEPHSVKTKGILNFLAQHLEHVQRHFHIVKIGLFGAFARQEQRQDSDIDIFIELQENTPNIYELKQELKEFIGSRFQRKVDIAREKYLKKTFKERILKEAMYVGEGGKRR